MRTTRRAAVTALVIAASSLIAACTPPTTVSPEADSRNWVAGYLVRQFNPADGDDLITYTVNGNSFTNLGATAYAMSNLGSLQTGATTRQKALVAFGPRVDEFVVDPGGHDLPGSLARLILAVIASDGDPHAYAGHDLVARLEATLQPSGLFGVQDPTYDGAFRQGLALAALSMVSPIPATVDPGAGSIADLPAVSWLLDQQCDDGSWQPIRTIPLTPCAFNPLTFSGPETNTTALAMLGLHAVGATPNIDPISWLNSVREADGGWSYDGNGPSDPSSTGLVIGARRAYGIAPDTAAIATLRSMQNIVTGVGNFDRGGFSYPGSAFVDLQSSNDATLGLAKGVWPSNVTAG